MNNESTLFEYTLSTERQKIYHIASKVSDAVTKSGIATGDVNGESASNRFAILLTSANGFANIHTKISPYIV